VTSPIRRHIPKNLFLFWHDSRDLPTPIRKSVMRCALRHSDYQVLLADDAYMMRFIETHHAPHVAGLYADNAIPASRSDLARVMLLLEHGGVYMDAEIEPMEHLDDIVAPATELWLMRWGDGYNNAVLGSRPGHPLLRRLLEIMLRNLERGYFNRNVAAATGPLCLSAVVQRVGLPPSSQVDAILDLHARGVFVPHGVAGVSGSWIRQQYRGIRRSPPRETQLASAGSAATDPSSDLMREERDYLETLPVDASGVWRNLPVPVLCAMNRRLTGSPDRSWLDDVAQRGPFPNIALLALGSGLADLAFLRRVKAERVTVFSPRPGYASHLGEVLQQLDSVHVDCIECELNDPPFPEGAFDLVLSWFSLHRTLDLDRLFGGIERALRRHGLLAFVEYVGEDRFQFSAERLGLAAELVRDAAAARAPESIVEPTPPLPQEFGPLGAVHSSGIIPAATKRFREHHHRRYSVATLPLLLMVHPAVTEDAVPLALEREDALLDAGYDGTLAYCIYGKSDCTAESSRADHRPRDFSSSFTGISSPSANRSFQLLRCGPNDTPRCM
jgi:SAM-dependent methyltransferase